MRYLALFILLVWTSISSAQTMVFYLNGIHVEDGDPELAVARIQEILRTSGFSQKFDLANTEYTFKPNPNDGVRDLLELQIQATNSSRALTSAKANSPAPDTITAASPEYKAALGKLYFEKIEAGAGDSEAGIHVYSIVKNIGKDVKDLVIGQGYRLIVVAHSQGNFFTEAVDAYIRHNLPASELAILEDRLRFVGAASVAASTPNGRYVSASEDKALDGFTLNTDKLANFDLLPRNADLCSITDLRCFRQLLRFDFFIHGFLEIYTANLVDSFSGRTLAYLVAKLISDSFDEMFGGIPTRYTIISLGENIPTAINDRGDIAGVCGTFACIRLAADGIWRSLGALGGSAQSAAYDIDSLGRVVGSSSTDPYVGQHAFRYSGVLGSPLIDITEEFYSEEPVAAAEAISISSSGFVAGTITFPSLERHAFLTINGVGQDLGALPGSSFSRAMKVNSSGTVVGYSTYVSGLSTAFVKTLADPSMKSITPFIGGNSAAYGMNDAGFVIGDFTQAPSWLTYYGFLYYRNPQTETETITQIKNGSFVHLSAINNPGDVVGTTDFGAFVYRDGTMRNLNEMIPPGSGWNLGEAISNNNIGQIIGRGTLNEQTQAFLLTPVR